MDAAAPGDTVMVTAGQNLDYRTGAVVTKSGTADAPITIVAIEPPKDPSGNNALIWKIDNQTPVFAINGASRVVLRGFTVLNYFAQPLVTVQHSSDITVDGFNQTMSHSDGGSGAITVDGTSSGITVSRSLLSSLTIGSGASDITVTTNSLRSDAPLLATGVSGLTITSNTIWHYCPSGIDVEGASQNVSIENNIVTDAWGWGPGISGPPPTARPASKTHLSPLSPRSPSPRRPPRPRSAITTISTPGRRTTRRCTAGTASPSLLDARGLQQRDRARGTRHRRAPVVGPGDG